MSLTNTLATSMSIEPEAVELRLAQWERSFVKLDPCERWILREACVGSLRLEIGEAIETAAQSNAQKRANFAWEEDRKLAVAELADRLSRRPALIAPRLRSTRHGCLWMAACWTSLRTIFQTEASWTDSHRSMAHDLLGTPSQFRDSDTQLDPADPSKTLGLINREIEVLSVLANGPLAALDYDQRQAATNGVSFEQAGTLNDIRKFLARCRRQVEWCWNQLKGFRKPVEKPKAQPRVVDNSRRIDPFIDADESEEESPFAAMHNAITDNLAQVKNSPLLAALAPVPAIHLQAKNRHARRAAKAHLRHAG